VCEEEIEFGITEYAVTVAGLPGEPPRSLTVVGPTQRLHRLVEEGMLDDLQRRGQEISDAMGVGARLAPLPVPDGNGAKPTAAAARASRK
jgi:hypothetical protein